MICVHMFMYVYIIKHDVEAEDLEAGLVGARRLRLPAFENVYTYIYIYIYIHIYTLYVQSITYTHRCAHIYVYVYIYIYYTYVCMLM